MKKTMAYIIVILMAMTLMTGCGNKKSEKVQEDIVVLFTNDVHCGIEENIGYAGLVSYKKKMMEQTPYVTLVDCGDAIQGEYIGAVSDGEYIVDIMNKVEYDFAILGNHEFDYGTERLSYLLDKAETQYLACNVTYTGKNTSALEKVVPCEIVEYGDVSVAYIGVSTPETILKSTPTYFMEDGEFVYSFAEGDGTELYTVVQKYIDECKGKGADYVVLLTHLGDTSESGAYASTELVANISGADVVLDAHSHSTVSCRVIEDKAGEDVLVSSTGTKLTNIGKLVITAAGNITVGLVDSYEFKDEETVKYINSIKAEYEAEMNRKVAYSDIALKGSTEDGIRLTRNRETTIGNFCADAYRIIGNADIGLLNGGGIRADLPKGDITYADIIAVHPFGNTLCTAYVTGAEVADLLEIGAVNTTFEVSEDGLAAGENGSFMSVSGLKFTIDTSIESSVVFDDKGFFVEVAGERRVKDIMVMNEVGEYEPIDLEKEYVMASHSYILKDSGSGATFFNDNEFIIDEGMSDYQMLIEYLIGELDGNLADKYSDVEGRITIK